MLQNIREAQGALWGLRAEDTDRAGKGRSVGSWLQGQLSNCREGTRHSRSKEGQMRLVRPCQTKQQLVHQTFSSKCPASRSYSLPGTVDSPLELDMLKGETINSKPLQTQSTKCTHHPPGSSMSVWAPTSHTKS